MINVSIVFNRRKTATKSTDPNPKKANVEIEFYESITRKRKWKTTGVRLYADEFKNGVVVGRYNARYLTEVIRKAYDKAVEAASLNPSLADITNDHLIDINFLDWMSKQIEERTDIKERTKVYHRRTVRYLEEHSCIRNFSDLTPANITKWDMELKKITRMQTSVYVYQKTLKAYVRLAYRLGLMATNPYDRIKTPKGTSRQRRYLTEEQRTAIENLELCGTAADVRDMFIFSCYTGLAYCDLIRVREMIVEEDGRRFIDGERLKSNTHYRLPLLPKADEILRRHNDDLNLISNQKANMFLKVIGTAAGIKTNISMHIARHTFATWALSHDIPIEIVSKMLAHTNIQTTQIYAKVMQRDVERAFDKLK